jgi:predicted amidohydrolase YtcJ
VSLYISNVEIDGQLMSVRINEGWITDIGAELKRPRGVDELFGDGGALLPGLHDHHIHLLSSAAALNSLPVGPPAISTRREFIRTLREKAISTPPGEWIRAIGYHESIAGLLDRHALDEIVNVQPLRIQHRSGGVWFLNTAGLAAAELEFADEPGVDRDAAGTATGRLWRADHLLRPFSTEIEEDLEKVSLAAASFGVTGFTDAAPHQTSTGLTRLVVAKKRGFIRQRLTLMSPIGLGVAADEGVETGPVKVMLDDESLPHFDELVAIIAESHGTGRSVAIHCATATQSVLALSALAEAGPNGLDRIEHGSQIPFDLDNLALKCSVTVVTQPHFIQERGDEYLFDIPAHLQHELYRAQTLVEAGIPVAAGSDAPFGTANPWTAMSAAIRRTTLSGAVIGPRERIAPSRALNLFLGESTNPAQVRRVQIGARADLCLLKEGRELASRSMCTELVRATIIDGEMVYQSS